MYGRHTFEHISYLSTHDTATVWLETKKGATYQGNGIKAWHQNINICLCSWYHANENIMADITR